MEIEAGDLVEITSGDDAGFQGFYENTWMNEAGEIVHTVLFSDRDNDFRYVKSIKLISKTR